MIDNKRVTIFEGSITSVPNMTLCLRGTTAAFGCVANNHNKPGQTIAQDMSQVLVAACMQLKLEDQKAKLPKLIFLSSSGVNEKMCKELGVFANWVLQRGAGNVYADLKRAESFMRLHQSWLTAVFVQPGGLVFDKAHGHELSTERQKTFLSFADLAGGMVELADDPEEKYHWEGVSVIPKGNETKVNYGVIFFMIAGLTVHFVPWTARFF